MGRRHVSWQLLLLLLQSFVGTIPITVFLKHLVSMALTDSLSPNTFIFSELHPLQQGPPLSILSLVKLLLPSFSYPEDSKLIV